MSEEKPAITVAIEVDDPLLADRLASLFDGVAGLRLAGGGLCDLGAGSDCRRALAGLHQPISCAAESHGGICGVALRSHSRGYGDSGGDSVSVTDSEFDYAEAGIYELGAIVGRCTFRMRASE